MAVTVSPDLTLICDGSSGQDSYWTGEDGVSTEVFQQGTSSQAWNVNKNSIESAVFDYYSANGNSLADMSGTDVHIYFHMRCDIAPFIDYVSFRLTDSSGNWSEWDIVDNTVAIEWYGEWKTFVLDISTTPDTTSGTLGKTQVRYCTWTVDNQNSGNIRAIENTYIDICRFGTGLQCWDSVGDPFNFGDIEAISNNGANKYGIIEKIGGIYFVRGRIRIGDDNPTNHYTANFVSNDEVVVFLDPSVSGESYSATLLGVTVTGHRDGTTTFQCGTKVGTGDAMSGRNGTTFMGESDTTEVSFTLPASTAVNGINLYATLFRNTYGPIDISGCADVGGCTFDACGMLDVGYTAAIRNCAFLNSTASATEGAIDWEPGTALKYCTFTNNINAILIAASFPASYTAVGLEFAGNTYDIRFDAVVDRDWNWSEALAAPTVNNVDTGTLTPINTVPLTIYDVTLTARIYIETLAGGPVAAGTELFNEVAGSATWNDTYPFTSNQPVVLRVRDASVPGAEKKSYTVNTAITAEGLSLVAVLIDDT